MHSSKQRRKVSTCFAGTGINCCLNPLSVVISDPVSSWGLLCSDESWEAGIIIVLQLLFFGRFLFNDCFRELTVSGKVQMP